MPRGQGPGQRCSLWAAGKVHPSDSPPTQEPPPTLSFLYPSTPSAINSFSIDYLRLYLYLHELIHPSYTFILIN